MKMSKTKILILHPIPGYSHTNTRKGVSQYAKYLNEAGYDVTLAIYEDEHNHDKDISIPGVEIDRISIIGNSSVWKTIQYLLRCDTDILLTQYFFEKRHLLWAAIMRSRNIPHLMMIDHTPDIPPLTPSMVLKHKIKLYILYNLSVHMYVKTNESMEQLESIYPKLKGKIGLLPSGVEDKFFEINNQETKTVVYVGRLGGDKNVKSLLKGFNKIKHKYDQWTLEIAGEGEQYPSIDTKNVVFHGHLDQDGVCDLYSKADIFCQPSSHESFSNVLIEAAASETAIISTRVGVAPALLEGAGIFINKRDPEDIAEKLDTYMSNTERRQLDSKRLREKATEYKINEVTKILDDQIQNM